MTNQSPPTSGPTREPDVSKTPGTNTTAVVAPDRALDALRARLDETATGLTAT